MENKKNSPNFRPALAGQISRSKFPNFKRKALSALSAKKRLWLLVSVIGILVDIFFLPFTSDLVILVFTLFWIGAVVGGRLEGRFSIFGALIFLTLCPFLLIFKKDPLAEKAAIWAYMFLVVGVIQQLIELKRKPKNLVNFDDFIKRIKETAKAFKNGFVRARAKLKGKSAPQIAKEAGSALGKLSVAIPQRLKKISREKKLFPPLRWLLDKTAIILEFIFKRWFSLLSALLLILIFTGLGREIAFYRQFFENQFWSQFWKRLGIWLISLGAGTGIFLFLIKKKRRGFKKIFLVILLFALWQTSALIFHWERNEFANKPYILYISPQIASQYQTVEIHGRNFRDLPFLGKVLINGEEQMIVSGEKGKAWTDQKITIVVDPRLSSSGPLEVWVNQDNEWVKSNKVNFIYYDSKTATPEEEKMFWESLKE